MSSNKWSSGSSQKKSQGSFGRVSDSSGSSGWGKQATKRFNASEVLKKDPLLKSLEGKIAVGFGDYKPWQRTSLPRNSIPMKPTASKTTRKESSRPLSSRLTRSSHSAGGMGGLENDRPLSGVTIHTQCSSVCLHPWLKKPVVTPTFGVDKKRHKFISILKMQIKTRKKTIGEYHNRKLELLEDNLLFKDKIESSEIKVHDNVKFLLQKYDKFRGALATLNKTFEEDLVVAKRNLKSTRVKVDKELKELQKELNGVQANLQKKLEEANILRNYKDKEYPEKALEIAKLKRKKEILQVAFKEELEELQAVIDAETSKFSQKTRTTADVIKVKAVEDIMKSLNQNVKDMALQNMIMKKEIEMHQNEVKLLETKNSDVENKIKSLLSSPELNTKVQMFPDVFGERVKCTPDMDVVLDIPTHKWLPI